MKYHSKSHKLLLFILFALITFSICFNSVGCNSIIISDDDSDSESITVALTNAETMKQSETDSTVAPITPPETPDTRTDEEKRADELITQMTVKEKLGQLLLVDCPSVNTAELISEYKFGGIMLFAYNFEDETSESIGNKIASYQSVCGIPLLVAVDEEGGTVNRVSRYKQYRSQPFNSPRYILYYGKEEGIVSDTLEKCQLLLSLGINVNLAPVCDVTSDSKSFMYRRSAGDDAETVSRVVETIVSVMHENKLGSSLKHFPGYGNNVDTHNGVAYDTRSIDELRENDFIPFQRAIAAGADSVMVSHIIVSSVDDSLPASLSAPIHSLIRDELAFDGVIITDELSMGAITAYTGGESAAATAFLAGNDLLCCSDYANDFASLENAYNYGYITNERLDESVRRILLWKINLGLI